MPKQHFPDLGEILREWLKTTFGRFVECYYDKIITPYIGNENYLGYIVVNGDPFASVFKTYIRVRRGEFIYASDPEFFEKLKNAIELD
jgi:hypothetical protein